MRKPPPASVTHSHAELPSSLANAARARQAARVSPTSTGGGKLATQPATIRAGAVSDARVPALSICVKDTCSVTRVAVPDGGGVSMRWLGAGEIQGSQMPAPLRRTLRGRWYPPANGTSGAARRCTPPVVAYAVTRTLGAQGAGSVGSDA